MLSGKRRFRIGIDVGLNSVGLAAVEIDDSSINPLDAMPIGFLSIMSVIHDGGVDPSAQKRSDSRKKVSGIARRARRLVKQRKKRYKALDELLERGGYPITSFEEYGDPYLPWVARIGLVESCVEDADTRNQLISAAVRHISRHRGWRNPYTSVASLEEMSKLPSRYYIELFEKVQLWRYHQGLSLYPGISVEEDSEGKLVVSNLPDWGALGDDRPTIAQMAEPFLKPEHSARFRRSAPDDALDGEFVHFGKVHQSDNYFELRKIFEKQGISAEMQGELFKAVFAQINPREVGAAKELVAHDDLQTDRIRASKASPAFQKYCILTTIGNLKIKESGKSRPLNAEERRAAYDFLTSEQAVDAADALTWGDVAEAIGVAEDDLSGVGGKTEDGAPISAKRPPALYTDRDIRDFAKKNKKEVGYLRTWWENASELEKEALVDFFDNAGSSSGTLDDDEMKARQSVEALFGDSDVFDDSALETMEKLSLMAGRAAYSTNTLMRLNARMLNEGLGLFEARRKEFEVPADWRPSANPLGTPTGNPAVDRTLKTISRWLLACEQKWGKPETVVIEHVRDGFKSDKARAKIRKEADKRYKANQAIRETLQNDFSEEYGSGIVKRSDIRRYGAIQRQNSKCLYCGKKIGLSEAEMDHIVPRKGIGSTNEISNLVAVCSDCNGSKSNTLFSEWADDERMAETLDRVDHWVCDPKSSRDDFVRLKKEVKARLKRTCEDDPIDNRSIESVAWMAREIKEQIEGHFGYSGTSALCSPAGDESNIQRVYAFKGQLTAFARRASGIEGKLPWKGVGIKAKTRLDRRHHAVDAAVIAMMRPGVAQVLLKRESMRQAEEDLKRSVDGKMGAWKEYKGSSKQCDLYCHWKEDQMGRLRDILTDAMKDGSLVVSRPLRLGLGLGRAHEDTICPPLRKRVGDALSVAAIDKVALPALWVALTNHPDYSEDDGLPEDWSRRIRLHDRWLSAEDEIYFMAAGEKELNGKVDAVYAPVGNGYAGIGTAIHHARFYRIPKLNKKGCVTGYLYSYMRVFQFDLLRHGKEDLFSVELPPCSISVRSADLKLKKALSDGSAEFLGWAVVGDEILIDSSDDMFSPEKEKGINQFMRAFPEEKSFVISGFPDKDRVKLRPMVIASEGLADLACEEEPYLSVKRVIERGCPLSVNKLLATKPTIVRRNTLGMMRWRSKNHMPTCWRPE